MSQKKKEANRPIIPVIPGGASPENWTDEYLKIYPEHREIEFVAPISKIVENIKKLKEEE